MFVVDYFNSLMARLILFNSDHGPFDYLIHDLNKNKFDLLFSRSTKHAKIIDSSNEKADKSLP